MLHTVIITHDLAIIDDAPLNRSTDADVKWFWTDFDSPDDMEIDLLRTHFLFHPLAIEDCLQLLQRPKLNHYEGYDFFVLQNLNSDTLKPQDINLFVGANFIVTFHLASFPEIELIRRRMNQHTISLGPRHLIYSIMDRFVDDYFPFIYKIEDKLNQIESSKISSSFIDELYKSRDELLSLRRIVVPMRELLYMILNTNLLKITPEEHMHFKDIHDHLVKINEMIDSNREITADIRDSYVSMNSYRMNNIMKTLTVISSIFIPLTFIVGIYGMNFHYMPELSWHWGYFASLGVMAMIALGMLLGFWVKGWFK